MGKTMAQVLEARGIEKGTIMTKQEVLIKLLNGKFSSIPQTIVEEIKSIYNINKLDMLFDCAIFAKTIEDIIIELEN
jgi:hypothetical protein